MNENSMKKKGLGEQIVVEYELRPKPKLDAAEFRTGYEPDANIEVEFETHFIGRDKVLGKQLEALKAVADQYRLPLKEWSPAFLEYVLDHEPSLQISLRKKGGRPKKWNMFLLACLWFDVEVIRKKTGLSVAAACMHLSKRPEWNRLKSESLEEMYSSEVNVSPLVRDLKGVVEKIGWEMFEGISSAGMFSLEEREKNLEDWKNSYIP